MGSKFKCENKFSKMVQFLLFKIFTLKSNQIQRNSIILPEYQFELILKIIQMYEIHHKNEIKVRVRFGSI
jgi:hypothetical protein